MFLPSDTMNFKHLLCLPICLLALDFAAAQSNQTLWVYVTGVKSIEHSLLNVGLYRAQDNFPKREGTFKHHIVEVNNDTMKVRFDVPFGTYAIGVSQDLNANNKLDRNNFGYPAEPFGFSRGFKPTFRGPHFNECAFEFKRQNQLIYLKLIH